MASLAPSEGGPARSVPQLAIAQANMGCQVSIWVCYNSVLDFADDSPGRHCINVLDGPLTKVIAPDMGFDVVHDHGIWSPFHHQVAALCRREKIPRIVSPRGMLEPWAFRFKGAKKRLAWWLYQKRDLMQANALHATAESEAKELQRLGVVTPIVVHPNGVTVGDTAVSSGRGACSGNGRTLLFLGRIHQKKGLILLAQAWAKIRPDNWQVRVVGADEDSYLSSVKRELERLEVSSDWSFDGPLEGADKWQAFREADLFVLPSYSENFGISIAEALSCSVPVITTTGTPWRGLLEYDCGWWVAPEVNSLAEALDHALQLPPDNLASMGRRGREWMRSEFSWSKIAADMLKSYENVISRTS